MEQWEGDGWMAGWVDGCFSGWWMGAGVELLSLPEDKTDGDEHTLID